MTSNLQSKRFSSDLPLAQLLDFWPQGYPEVSPSESIQFRMLFIICKNKYRKYRKPRQQIKRTHFPWNLSKRSVHSTFSFQSSVTGCCSPGSLWPCRTNQNFMATGVDTSENFDATTWPQALFGWHETLATASWQSWQWDAVSSWTDVIFSEASLTVVGLLAPGLSGGESFRMHVHVIWGNFKI